MDSSFPLLAEIKKRRVNLGLSQKQLAELCGIGQSFFAKVERGAATPSYPIATRIFEKLADLESKGAEKLLLVSSGGGPGSRTAAILTAKDLMTPRVVAFSPYDAAEDVLAAMLEKDISQVPVLDDDKGFQVGVVTEKTLMGKDVRTITITTTADADADNDVVVAIGDGDHDGSSDSSSGGDGSSSSNRLTVKQVMDKHIFPAVPPDARLPLIISILNEEQAVLVMEKGKVVGIVTKQDVLRKQRPMKRSSLTD
jgi:predicted transcriptional regulator